MVFLQKNYDLRLFNAPRGTFLTFSGNPIKIGVDGQCDIRGFWRVGGLGIALEIEVKTGSGILNKDQKLWRAMCLDFNVVHLEARSLEQVKEDMDKKYLEIMSKIKKGH